MDESLHFVSMSHAAKEFWRKETKHWLVRIFWWTLKITGEIKGLTDKTRITIEMSLLSESVLKRF